MKIEILKTIVSDQLTHARWLNTLSFLEHIGCRKIIKSQDSSRLDLHMLQHIAEEARHAYFFKRILEKNFSGLATSFALKNLLAGTAPEEYFQNLDEYIDQELSHLDHKIRSYLSYLYVTWLIEERAMTVYQNYQLVLDEFDISISLKTLLAEETNHLKETIRDLKKIDIEFSSRKEKFLIKENSLFSIFEQAIKSELEEKKVEYVS